MTGNLDMRNNKITNLPTPTGNAPLTPKSYVDTNFLTLSGGTMSGALAMGNNKMTGLPWATQNGNAVDFEFFNSWTIPSQRIGNTFTYKGTTVIYNIRKIGDPREVITRDTCDKSFNFFGLMVIIELLPI